MKYFYFYSHFSMENKEFIFTIRYLCKQYTLKTSTTDFWHNLSERNTSFATKSSKIRSFFLSIHSFKLFAIWDMVQMLISSDSNRNPAPTLKIRYGKFSIGYSVRRLHISQRQFFVYDLGGFLKI